jgi:hypothetical protein
MSLTSLAVPSQQPLVRSRPGGQSSSSSSSKTIVQQGDYWQEPPLQSQSTPMLAPSPVIDTAPSTDVPWERLAIDINGTLIEDLTAEYPELRPAHRDIVWETRSMSATEARAYVQGRLASIPPAAVEQIKSRLAKPQTRRLSGASVNNPPQMRNIMALKHAPQPRRSSTVSVSDVKFARRTQRSKARNEKEEKSNSRVYEVSGNVLSTRPNLTESPKSQKSVARKPRVQSLNVFQTIRRVTESPPNSAGSAEVTQDPLARLREQERKKREKRKTISAPIPIPTSVSVGNVTIPPMPSTTQKAPPRRPDTLKSSQAIPQGKSKKSRITSLGIMDLRPLSAISERPWTSRSWKSSKSRASKAERESLEKPPPLPTMPARLSMTNLELVVELRKQESNESTSSASDKALPPIPDTQLQKPVQIPPWLAHPSPLRSHPINASKTNIPQRFETTAAPKPRFFGSEKSTLHNSSRITLPSSVMTGRQVAAREALRKKESRLRVLAFPDSLDKEFGVWLKALPYIEGRAGTPNSKRNSWKELDM